MEEIKITKEQMELWRSRLINYYCELDHHNIETLEEIERILESID